jgi:glucuronoarabinoxylan endo-1,4-beta-xylanase
VSDASADLAFSVDAGAGLSLLRVRIAPDGTCLETKTAQMAQARGAKVWAAPWSPPAAWKTNDNTADGGTLLPEHYDDWAQTIVTFVRTMNSNGVQLAGVSAQNEPGFLANYESCIYTPDQLTDFIANHLGPAFADAGLLDSNGQPLKIIAPETPNWDGFPNFEKSIRASGAAMSQIGVMASHAYSTTVPSPDPTINAGGQSYWETEVYDKRDPVADDPGMGSGLWVAQQIHAELVNANVNAWHYWWIYPQAPDNGALWSRPPEGGAPLPSKRLYVMGNFSRFVRPGFYRVNATPSTPNGVLTSAYYDPASSSVVIVAINQDACPMQQTFQFQGATTDSWTSWVTSDTESLDTPHPIAGGDPITTTLPAQSVTTFVGTVTSIADAGPASANPFMGAAVSPPPQSCLPDAGDASAPYVSIPATNTSTESAGGCGLACSSAGGLAGGTAGAAAASSFALLGVFRRRSRRRRR